MKSDAPSTRGEGGFDVRLIVGDELDHWDRLAATFNDFSVEQTVAYLAPRVGRQRLCGMVLRERDSGKIVAAALVALALLPVLRRGLAFLKFGPMWRPRDRPAAPTVLLAALSAIRTEFVHERRLLVRLWPPPDPEYDAEWEAALEATDFRRGRHDPDPDRFFVDLSLPEKTQLASLGKDWRANLRKASPELSIGEADPKRRLDEFLRLYGAMWSRKQFVDRHNMGSVEEFVAAADPTLAVRLFLCRHGDEPVAGTLVVGPGERIFVMYGASSDAALKLRAGYALRWWMLNELRSSGARWLDLGGAEGDEGLRSFKAGLSGKEGWIALLGAEHECGGDPISAVVGRGIGGVRRVLDLRARRRSARIARTGS